MVHFILFSPVFRFNETAPLYEQMCANALSTHTLARIVINSYIAYSMLPHTHSLTLAHIFKRVINAGAESKSTKKETITTQSWIINLPFVAITIKSSWCIDAYVLATAVRNFTFINRASIFRFILAARTVNLCVAHFGIRYAHATSTVEFRFSVTFLHWGRCKISKTK